jgi:hypothetical protein
MSALVDRIKADALAGAAYHRNPACVADIGGISGSFGQLVQRAAAEAAATGRDVEIARGVVVSITKTSPPLIAVSVAPDLYPDEAARIFLPPSNNKKPADTGQKRGGLPKEI